jgi:hypothetical protein
MSNINIFSPDLNTPELDNNVTGKLLRCARCLRKIAMVKNRNNRMDCDAGSKNHVKLVSYHNNCWIKEVNDL